MTSVKAGRSMKGFCMVRKKLKSNDGASLMLALLFFLVCAAAGAVILASATASVGRVTSLQDTDRQQEECAVESAAALLKSELITDDVYVKIQKTSPKFSNVNEVPDDSVDGWTTDIVGICGADGTIKDNPDGFMEQFIDSLINRDSIDYDSNSFLKNTSSSGAPVLEIAVDNNNSFPAVLATPSLSGDSQDSLSITLKVKDGGSDSSQCTITGKIQIETVSDERHITSPEETDVQNQQYQQVKTKIVKYSWTNLKIGD